MPATDAAAALPYFMQDRIAVLGPCSVQNLSQGAIGNEARATPPPTGGVDHRTVFARSGAAGDARQRDRARERAAHLVEVTLGWEIIQRAGGQPLPKSAIVNQSLGGLPPRHPPLADATWRGG